jgi:hypothetical protein
LLDRKEKATNVGEDKRKKEILSLLVDVNLSSYYVKIYRGFSKYKNQNYHMIQLYSKENISIQ